MGKMYKDNGNDFLCRHKSETLKHVKRRVNVIVSTSVDNSAIQCLTTLNCRAQWLSGRVLDSRPKGRGFEPHRRHCVMILEQDAFILA